MRMPQRARGGRSRRAWQWVGALLAAACILGPLSGRAEAGDITSKLAGGTLTLKGDNDGNAITIDQSNLATDQLRVTPGAATTLDGAASAQVFNGVTKKLRVLLRNGPDTLLLEDSLILGKLDVKTGNGSDKVTVHGVSIRAAAKIDLGNGDNALALCSSGFDGKLRIKHGNGADGRDEIRCPGVDDIFEPRIATGKGSGSFVFDCTLAGDLKVTGKASRDTVSIHDSLLTGTAKIALGAGGGSAALCFSTVLEDFKTKFTKTKGVGRGPAFCAKVFPDGSRRSLGVTGEGVVAILDATVHGTLQAKLGSGDDQLFARSLDGPERVKVDLGKGPNSLTLIDATVARLAVKGRSEGDTLHLSLSSITGKSTLNLGNGQNSILATTTTFDGDLRIKTGRDDDSVDLSGATVTGTLKVETGAGNDTVL